MGLHVIHITKWREFLGLRKAWNELADQDADACLLGHDWASQCAKFAVAAGHSLDIAAVRGGDGDWLAFLAMRRTAGRVRRLCFFDDQRSQRLDFLVRAGCEATVLHALAGDFRRRRDWDILDLRRLRQARAEVLMRQWSEAGLQVRDRGTVRQRRVRLDRPWEEIENGFSPYLRANFERRQKRLMARGPVRLELARGRESLAAQLDECFQLEAAGWKGQRGTSILSDPDLTQFYRQLAFRLAARNRLWLYRLRSGKELVAFELCVGDAGGALSSLKIAYDESYRNASPGVVLRWLLLREAANRFSSYEFLGEDAAWKAEWTRETTTLRHVRIYHNTWRGRALHWRARAYGEWRRWDWVNRARMARQLF